MDKINIKHLCKNVDDTKIYNRLLENNYNIVDNKSKSLLMKSCKYSKFKIVEYLVKNGANVNYIDKNGDTPLLYLLKLKKCKDKINKFKILLNYKCDLNISNKNGFTPIMIVTGIYDENYVDVDIFKILIENNINVNIKLNDISIIKLLEKLYENNKIDIHIIGQLIKKGAKIDELNENLLFSLAEEKYINYNIYNLLNYLMDKSSIIKFRDCDICFKKGGRIIACEKNHYICFMCLYKLNKITCEFCYPR